MDANGSDDRREHIAAQVLAISPAVRYVAVADATSVRTIAAPGRAQSSAGETDYYEERLVNPVMLELARRRGNEGCGGFDCIVIRYGFFWQLLLPGASGHVSVCLEPDANPFAIIQAVRAATHELGTATAFGEAAAIALELGDEPFIYGQLDEAGAILRSVYRVDAGVRYVAFRRGRSIVLSSRIGDPGTSEDRSDRYEELIVNPTLLELATARGSIDCGGLRHITVAYPGFFAVIFPIEDGHVTVSLGRDADPATLAPALERAVAGR